MKTFICLFWNELSYSRHQIATKSIMLLAYFKVSCCSKLSISKGYFPLNKFSHFLSFKYSFTCGILLFAQHNSKLSPLHEITVFSRVERHPAFTVLKHWTHYFSKFWDSYQETYRSFLSPLKFLCKLTLCYYWRKPAANGQPRTLHKCLTAERAPLTIGGGVVRWQQTCRSLLIGGVQPYCTLK